MRALVLEATWAPRAPTTPEERATRHARAANLAWRDPRLVVRDIPEPTPGHGEVLVAIHACGVCGSDAHCAVPDADGWVRFSGPAQLPCVMGHEYAGTVVAVGPGVSGLPPGALVCGEGMRSCGGCEPCRRGRPNQCVSLRMVGFSAPGAFASLLCVEARLLWRVEALAERYGDAAAALDAGALVEPVACAYNGLFVAAGGWMPGAHVAVFGAGPIGLGAVALARAAGAASVTVLEPSAPRRDLATRMGADATHDPGDVDVRDTLMQASRGLGVDVVVEAAGAADRTLPACEDALAAGGRIVYLGRTGHRTPVRLDALVSQAAMIHGARGHSGGGCFPAVLRLMAAGRLDLSPMITRRVPLESAADAVRDADAAVEGKIVVHPADTTKGTT
jgi:threonine dehydrogenase-like Zn-dependent dehydrogenase